MATYRVVHGTVVQGGQSLVRGEAIELSEKDAKHLNKHGDVVLLEADFAKLARKEELEAELVASAKKAKKAPAPEPELDEDDAEDDADEEADELEEPAPTAPEPPAKKARGKKAARP